MFTYDHFQTGKHYGSDRFEIDQDRIGKWLAVYPDDDNGALMPPSMMAMIQMQCYFAQISPRPKGNVHGGQTFELMRIPNVGEILETSVICSSKEIRKGRKWVTLGYETRDSEGALVFTSEMIVLCAS